MSARAALAALLAVLLSACTPSNVKPEAPILTGVKTLEPQLIPILRPCLDAADIPKPPASWMAGRTGWHAELAAAIDLKELDAYVVASQSRMWYCVKSFEGDKPK